jgi:hypothetical protein
LDSDEAIENPLVGPGGQMNGGEYVDGGLIMPMRETRFPGQAIPAEVGTVELWVEPTWAGPDAPDRGTLFWRGPLGELRQSAWDLTIDNPDHGPARLLFNLTEDTGREHVLATPLASWAAGQVRHVMIAWNRFTGAIWMAVDGEIVARQDLGRPLTLSAGGQFDINRTGPRKPSECIYRGLRISNVERVPADRLDPPEAPADVRGLIVRPAQ